MTDQDVWNLFRGELWSDIDQSKIFPAKRPLLAHYTSLLNAEQILRNNEIWFSHPHAMNDLEELNFGIKSGVELFQNSEKLESVCGKEEFNALQDHFSALINDFWSGALDVYVFCLREHKPDDNDGCLSMWRSYGGDGSGAALVFNTENIANVEEGPSLAIAPVEYQSKSNRRTALSNMLARLAGAISSNNLTPSQLKIAAELYLHRLIYFSLFTKHDAFIEENEWRVVYLRRTMETWRSNNPDTQLHYEKVRETYKSMLGYSVTEKGVQARLKLSLRKLNEIGVSTSLSEMLDRLILGPVATKSPFEFLSIQRMLEVVGMPNLSSRLYISNTPYKPK